MLNFFEPLNGSALPPARLKAANYLAPFVPASFPSLPVPSILLNLLCNPEADMPA